MPFEPVSVEERAYRAALVAYNAASYADDLVHEAYRASTRARHTAHASLAEASNVFEATHPHRASVVLAESAT